jgi:hypothetical protein
MNTRKIYRLSPNFNESKTRDDDGLKFYLQPSVRFTFLDPFDGMSGMLVLSSTKCQDFPTVRSRDICHTQSWKHIMGCIGIFRLDVSVFADD